MIKHILCYDVFDRFNDTHRRAPAEPLQRRRRRGVGRVPVRVHGRAGKRLLQARKVLGSL